MKSEEVMSSSESIWVAQAVALLAGERAAERLRLLQADPLAYRRKHARMLASRGIAANDKVADAVLLEVAFFDAVTFGKRAIECDWREEPAEVLRLFRTILPTPKAAWRSLHVEDENTPGDVARLVGKALVGRGEVVLRYPSLNDSFCFALAREADVARACELLVAGGLRSLVEDLGPPATKRKGARRALRANSWAGFLAREECFSTNSLLIHAAADESVLGRLKESLALVPRKEKEGVLAFVEVISGGAGEGHAFAERAHALGYLKIHERHAPLVARQVRSMLREALSTPGFRSEFLGVIAYPRYPDDGRQVMGLLSDADRAAIRAYVLDSFKSSSRAVQFLFRAINALAVVGVSTDARMLTTFANGDDEMLATEARKTMRFLKRLKTS
jgi:hypothetical protein